MQPSAKIFAQLAGQVKYLSEWLPIVQQQGKAKRRVRRKEEETGVWRDREEREGTMKKEKKTAIKRGSVKI